MNAINLKSLCSLFEYKTIQLNFNKFNNDNIEPKQGDIVYTDNNNVCAFDNIIGCADDSVDTFYTAIVVELNTYESEYDDYIQKTATIVDIIDVDRSVYFEKMQEHLNQGFKSSQLFDEFIEDVEIDELEELIETDDADIEGGV